MLQKKYIIFTIILIGLFIPSELIAQGCSQCKMLVENSGENIDDVGRGINAGILYLVAIPYIIFLVFARKRIVRFFKEFRNAKG